MSRKARIDASGALHHIIVRGIERRPIFRDDRDRDNFLERLARILAETETPCYAWALIPNHVHLLLSVPPKFSIANTVGFLKGKSAIRINRDLGKVKGSLYGRAFWSRGYCVSTVGLDEAMIRDYIQNQEKTERDEERGLFDID